MTEGWLAVGVVGGFTLLAGLLLFWADKWVILGFLVWELLITVVYLILILRQG